MAAVVELCLSTPRVYEESFGELVAAETFSSGRFMRQR